MHTFFLHTFKIEQQTMHKSFLAFKFAILQKAKY